MKSNDLMICEYFCKSLFSYLAVACAPPFPFLFYISSSKGQAAHHYCRLPEKSTRENKLLLENYNELLW